MTAAAPMPTKPAGRIARAAIFLVWAGLAGYLIWHHVFWRDEIRALTLALQGGRGIAGWLWMLRGIHGEGHPALWYVLLRGANDLMPVKQVLPAVAALIGALAAGLLAARAPFRWWWIALILGSAFCLYDYTVSARNYGLTMFLLFVIADRLARHRDSGRRDRGIGLGLLLALLCNTNVPAAMLAAGILLFRAAELLARDGWRWTRDFRDLAVSAGIATAGALVCVATVYPPVNDAATVAWARMPAAAVAAMLLAPAAPFDALLPAWFGDGPLAAAVLAVLVLGSPLGLIRAPAAWLSTVAVLTVLTLFFGLIYPGSYRHQALYPVYLIAMYWLVAAGRGGAWPARWHAALIVPERCGRALLVCLLALQVLNSVPHLIAAAYGPPESRVGDLAAVLRAHHLERAILVSDPDVMLEPLPYYADNPIYLLRSRHFGRVVPFSDAARRPLSLGEMLARMRALHTQTGQPVVALLQFPLPEQPAAVVRTEGYLGVFTTTPAEVGAFRAATRRIASFAPAVSDERYDVYLLR
jgi:hypothetical protein